MRIACLVLLICGLSLLAGTAMGQMPAPSANLDHNPAANLDLFNTLPPGTDLESLGEPLLGSVPVVGCCPGKAATDDGAGESSNMGLLFFVFVLAIFLGVELISKVPSQLHTPLMSGSNAISGITIVGALLAAGQPGSVMTTILGVLAVAFAMINVMGGYLVTDRMLGMFKRKG